MVFLSCRFIQSGSGHEEQHKVSVELCRWLLWKLTGRSEWEFSSRNGGKPYIVGETITYSVSHTDGCVICAVSAPDGEIGAELPPAPEIITGEAAYRIEMPCRHGEIGCDVELCAGDVPGRMLQGGRAERIAARYFSETEQNEYTSSGRSIEAFYRIWTAKESIVKATGEGIGSLAKTDSGDTSRHVTVSFEAHNGESRFLGAVTVLTCG